MPNDLLLQVTTTSNEHSKQKSYFQSTIKLPFMCGFEVLNLEDTLELSKSTRSRTITVKNPKDMEFRMDDETAVLVKMTTDDDKKKGELKISIPEAINSSFKNKELTLFSKVSNQKKVIFVNFDNTDESEYFMSSWINHKVLIDMITLIVISGCIFVVFNFFYRKQLSSNNYVFNDKNFSQGPRGSNIRSSSLNFNNK